MAVYTWSLGDRITAARLNDSNDATTAVHGVGAGAVVGTTLTQTLTNKTLTAPTINACTLSGTLTIGSQIFDAGSSELTLNTTGAATGLTLTSTQDGATGAMFLLRQNSASPAINDKVGVIGVSGKNDATQYVTYGELLFRISDETDGTEDGRLEINLMRDGASTLTASLSSTGAWWVDEDISFTTSVDSAAVADTVSLGGYEISAGHRALAISSEEVVVTETDETKFSHKLPVRINGATYNLMLCAT